ncbi:MAG: hypothetical protein WA899_21690, partial [Candidatus Sulfotelmatobacter sp.]
MAHGGATTVGAAGQICKRGTLEGATLICSWYFCSCPSTTGSVVDDTAFFRALGRRVRDIRKRKGLSQEDMIEFCFS